MLSCAKGLKKKNNIGRVVFLASVQEEVGLRGATIGSYRIKPDIAVAIDVTHAITPMVDKSDGFPLGSGCAIAVGPNIDQNIANHLKSLQKKIRYHTPLRLPREAQAPMAGQYRFS